jgi:hypothetical protein
MTNGIGSLKEKKRMSELFTQAESAAKMLLKADEDQLYEQLGIRTKAIEKDPATAGYFSPNVVYDQAEMGLKEDVRELGEQVFRRWNAETYKLVCGSEYIDKKNRAEIAKAFGIGDVEVAAALSALLITSFGVAPAISAIIAALIVKRFFRPGYEEFCQVWQKHIAE